MKDFFELIDRLNDAPGGERGEIERELVQRYQRDKAVLALDMSGFSLTVRRSGIVSYLCCIRRMQQIMQPLLSDLRGELVKFEADNLLAVFDRPADALAAELAMHRAVQASETPLGEVALAVGIGMDYGPVLLIPGKDCYGDAVNMACKLGEDVARAGEILLTRAMAERLGDARGLEALELSIAGMQISAYRVMQA